MPPPAELPWLDKSLSPAARAQMLVRAMTLEEKIAVLSGSGRKNENGQIWQVYVKGNPRLGIPDMTQGDAPNGIMIGSDAVTQMPNGTALAATFSRVDARAYGGALGAETRALGYGVLHGPNLDVNRDPRHGRTHETFGEDPFLAGQIAAEYVKGVQANRVIADAKHYAVNTVEKGRMGLDAQMDQRTLHELYLPPFQVAVQEGKLGMIMCAYNKINGVQACDRADMLNGLLREKWGFDGVVRTDFRAAHALEAIVAGLDQEFANTLGWGDSLLAAVRAGTIPESAVDTAVERVMRTMIAYGIFDDPPKRVGADLAASAKVAERLAADSVVVLRNERALLPLDPNRTKRIAVIGAAADDRASAGGPGAPAPTGKVTILEGIKARVPSAAIEFQSGIDPLYSISKENGYPQIPSGALTAHDGSHGASATYYAADGKPLVTRTDICVCYTPNTFFETNVSQQDSPQGTARVAWVATLTAGQTGDYGFDVASNGRAELKIDGLSIAASKGGPAPAPVVGSMRLAKGAHSVEVAYEVGDNWRDPLFGIATTPKLKVGWLAPANVADAKIKAAVEAAKRADVAIVVVRDLEAEGMDRPNLTLPNDQDRLIQAVTKANPKTVVVLATGSAVTMPWLEQTPAVVEAWYGGTRGGPALASVLFGDVNPSGRLPLSFPKADRDLPTYDPARFPGNGYVLKFTEGLSTGYRHYKASGARRARYPFGYSLSYTQFVYSRLTLDRSAFKAGVAGVDGTPKGEPAITVKFSVTNTGKRAGAAVPQLYVEYPKAAGEPAPLLRGFDKVELEPGRSKQVAIALDQRAFSIYDPKAGAWTVVPGQYRVRVGDSSADTALIASLQVE